MAEFSGIKPWKGAGVWFRRTMVLVPAVLLVILTILLGVRDAAAQQGDVSSVTVLDARIAGDNVRTRFVLDLSSEITPEVSGLADPYRLILDFPAMAFNLPGDVGEKGRGLIAMWRYGVFVAGKSRIVLDVNGPVSVDKMFVLPAVDKQPVRFVLDLVKSNPAEYADFVEKARASRKGDAGQALAKGDRETQSREGERPLIVLDPGHGGIDTGAVGGAGTLEKAVVLDFSSLLKRKLEETGNYQVKLTREDDTFIRLRDRVRLGHDAEADLFISIHADSVRHGKNVVRGATVYTLSDNASDDLAAELAETENMSDIIAGVELHDEPEEVTNILLDLARRETRNFSVHFARTLVSELESAVRLIKNPHRSAGFKVLKAHDIPSVLVELGYLSNEHDEKLLVSEEWRERMADAMVEAIEIYFRPQLERLNAKTGQ